MRVVGVGKTALLAFPRRVVQAGIRRSRSRLRPPAALEEFMVVGRRVVGGSGFYVLQKVVGRSTRHHGLTSTRAGIELQADVSKTRAMGRTRCA